MVGIRPFIGQHIRPDFVRRVPAPAFDSMSGEERRTYLETHPESYTLVTRSPGDGGPEHDADTQRLIDLGGEALQRIVDAGAFEEVDRPALFLYRLSTGDHSQLGIVSLVAVQDYLEGRVKRHEQVNLGRAGHLSQHFEQLGAQSSPIALGYRSDPAIRSLLDDILSRTAPVVEFTSGDGLEQAVWVIDDETDCAGLVAALSSHDLYIMDGHHRAAAAGQLLERVPHALDADVDAVHRELIDTLALVEDESPQSDLPEWSGGVGVWMDGRWWSGTLPAPVSDSPLDSIEPVRLQTGVLGPILGIDPSRPQGRIDYFLDEKDRSAMLEGLGVRDLLFVLRPVSPAEVFAVADAGLDMPPKSTYVFPKPRSGVFLRRF
jgi:uncharacterized protein (DUF1015 family)